MAGRPSPSKISVPELVEAVVQPALALDVLRTHNQGDGPQRAVEGHACPLGFMAMRFWMNGAAWSS